MSGDSDYDFLAEWLDKAPHKNGCTNEFVSVACSCGLDEARKALIGIGSTISTIDGVVELKKKIRELCR